MKAVGEAIDESSNKIRNVTKAVDSTNERINKTQDRLVELLKTYRRPNMLCLDITLIVLLLGLIAVIVNMVRSKTM
jgi:beta-lactamase regulating signal transducer with metallopeptidase domain